MDLLKKYKNMLDNKKQHNYILNMLEMTGQLAERKVENGNGIYNQVQVFETQLGLNLVVSNYKNYLVGIWVN